jgi:hypothetical protein
MTIYLFKRPKYRYSNRYYPRKYDLESLKSQATSWETLEYQNFNPNDYCTASIIVNTTSRWDFVYCEDNDTRWFVTSQTFLRADQARLILTRDIISDNLWANIDNDYHMGKASIITDDISYAQYGQSTNLSQVKVGETLLKDGYGKGWIYVYMAKNAVLTTSNNHLYVPKQDNAINNSVTVTDAMIADLKAKTLCVVDDVTLRFYARLGTRNTPYHLDVGTSAVTRQNVKSYTASDFYSVSNPSDETLEKAFSAQYSDILADFKTNSGYLINEEYNSLIGLNGATLIDSNSNSYSVTVEEKAFSVVTYYLSNETFATTYASATGMKTAGQKILSINVTGHFYDITITKLANTSTSMYRMPGSLINNRSVTKDALYDIMALPLGANVRAYKDGNKTPTMITTAYEDTITFVQTLKKAMGDNIYDIQWLPYGPFAITDPSTTQQSFAVSSKRDTIKTGDATKTDTTTDGDSKVTSETSYVQVLNDSEATTQQTTGFVYDAETDEKSNVAWCWLSTSSIHRSVASSLIDGNSSDYMENRIRNETTFYRLCAPNWASTFEFRPVCNNGLRGYNIDMTLKPYTPFVRVQPIFGGLYGENYNDPRGLVFSGDFSIEQVSDAWQQYKLQNKNYELIFNRQIESLDTQQSVARRQDAWNYASDIVGTITTPIQNAAEGTKMGLVTGNPALALGGGIAGGITGLAGGVMNLIQNNAYRDMAEAMRSDTRNATICQWQYQTGNIKALPYSLSKTSSFDVSYRIFPVLEEYSCTPEELGRLRKTIEYNGIDINEVCNLSDFLSHSSEDVFVSAYPLRTESTMSNDEYEMFVSTLEKGIYIEHE